MHQLEGRLASISGELLVMAGGQADDIASLEGIFEAVGDTVIHVGEMGCGLKAKLVNNYTVSTTL